MRRIARFYLEYLAMALVAMALAVFVVMIACLGGSLPERLDVAQFTIAAAMLFLMVLFTVVVVHMLFSFSLRPGLLEIIADFVEIIRKLVRDLRR